MPDYRPVPEDSLEAYNRMQDYAFSLQDGRREYESEEDLRPGLAARRGLYETAEEASANHRNAARSDDGDDLLCIAAYYDFEARLRGEWFRVGGVSSVATPPEHRRGGLIRRMLREMLAEFREEGIHLSALWPFEYGFYRKYGWDMADRRTSYEFEPGALSFVTETEPVGEFRPVEADEYETLNGVYDAFMRRFDLATRRGEEWWRERIFERWGNEPYVYVWEAGGEARGYLAYTVSKLDGRWSRKLSVHEFAYADPVARRELLRFLYNHDSQIETVELHTCEETTLLDQVDDPRAVECTVKPGPMFRLVDVADAIEGLPYDEALAGDVTVTVADPLEERNDGTFALSFADGRATCRPADGEAADASCAITTLSQLYAGHLSPGEAADLGDLSVESPSALDVLSRAFPSRPTYLPEAF